MFTQNTETFPCHWSKPHKNDKTLKSNSKQWYPRFYLSTSSVLFKALNKTFFTDFKPHFNDVIIMHHGYHN